MQVPQETGAFFLPALGLGGWRWTPGSRGPETHSLGATPFRGLAPYNGPPPVGLPLRQKAKGGAAALEGRLAGVEWGVLAALAA